MMTEIQILGQKDVSSLVGTTFRKKKYFNYCHCLSSRFSNCTQNDVTSQCLSLTVRLKNPTYFLQVGGSVSLADFCPYVQEFTWKSESESSSRGSQCFDETNNPESGSNFGLENYGDGSLCFEQGSAWQQRSCTVLKQVLKLGAE